MTGEARAFTTSWMNDADRKRFWAKVDKDGPLPDEGDPLVSAPRTPCWVWTAARRNGYGAFMPDGRRGGRIGKTGVASRLSYMESHGGIESSLEVDHLCRNRACVNPDHLEAVTRTVNMRRGDTFARAHLARTHCPRGHAYDEANTHISPRNQRLCRTCHREGEAHRRATDPEYREHRRLQARAYRARLKAEARSIAT